MLHIAIIENDHIFAVMYVKNICRYRKVHDIVFDLIVLHRGDEIETVWFPDVFTLGIKSKIEIHS